MAMEQEHLSGTATIIENQVETNNTTQHEDSSNCTVREDLHNLRSSAISVGSVFRKYQVVKQLPSTSTEADIFIIEKAGEQFFLKLYRYDMDPNIKILRSIQDLGKEYPKNFIKVFEADFDADSQRWFEIQEYMKLDSLQTIINELTNYTDEQRKDLFQNVTCEVGETLNILHEKGFLHRDVKPSNILIRSRLPLNVVLIDFGITSALESDMSKKVTRIAGTPMYQSPESFSGISDVKTGERRVILGAPTDWWGLGMILLEIAAGAHPFKHLDSNLIAYSIATESVNIPDNLSKDQKELLHGLLTRNPEKRWGWAQVSRWLKGEHNIPNYFEESVSDSAITNKPYTFMQKKYYSLAELAKAFVRDEDSWTQGREHLLRGYVRQWLEGIQDFDTSVELVNVVSEAKDSDVKLFNFVQKYGVDIPFIFCGHAITFNNLLRFAGQHDGTEFEKKIVDMISNGQLLSCLDFCLKCRPALNDEKLIQSLLRKLKRKSSNDILRYLHFISSPQLYYCPFLENASTPEEVVNASEFLESMPMTMEYFNHIDSDFIIPAEFIENMRVVSSYSRARSELEAMETNKQLISRKEYDRLNTKYILPHELLIKLNSSKSYTAARGELQRLESEKLLILRSNSSVNEKLLKNASMSEYLHEVYKLQWGYDDAIINKVDDALSKFRKQARSAKDFELAQLQLWIAYLEFISSKSVPLANEDRKILLNISLRNTNDLENRISAIVNN